MSPFAGTKMVPREQNPISLPTFGENQLPTPAEFDLPLGETDQSAVPGKKCTDTFLRGRVSTFLTRNRMIGQSPTRYRYLLYTGTIFNVDTIFWY